MSRWLIVAALAGCGSSSSPGDLPDAASRYDAGETTEEPDGSVEQSSSFVVVTMNTGTTTSLNHDSDGDAYGDQEADTSDAFYGNGLAWKEAVAGTRDYFATLNADIVVFQEIFHPGDCPDIPAGKRAGFVCEDWQPGDPTVAQTVLGDGWQVACHPERPDKCAAVRKSFGTFAGCEEDHCLDSGLAGFRIEDCGGGARVARGLIERANSAPPITLVSIHGTSGLTGDDRDCRVKQVDQVFVDLGDGSPGVSGNLDVVMGDFNTDPGRLAGFDESAERWLDEVEENPHFEFITEVGEDATPSYAGALNIDHVIGGGLRGECWTAGITEGHEPVLETVYYDHHPVVCTVSDEIE